MFGSSRCQPLNIINLWRVVSVIHLLYNSSINIEVTENNNMFNNNVQTLSDLYLYLTGFFFLLIESSHSDSLQPLEERYCVIFYADDLNAAITSIYEFKLVDNASGLFIAVSGCRLHRDPASQQCKFIPLGKWRRSLYPSNPVLV